MKQSGYYFIEGMPIGGAGVVQPGTSEPEKWTPYKLWVGDKWECEGCGATILSGFGRSPINEHYRPDFADDVARLNAGQFQVNDC